MSGTRQLVLAGWIDCRSKVTEKFPSSLPASWQFQIGKEQLYSRRQIQLLIYQTETEQFRKLHPDSDTLFLSQNFYSGKRAYCIQKLAAKNRYILHEKIGSRADKISPTIFAKLKNKQMAEAA